MHRDDDNVTPFEKKKETSSPEVLELHNDEQRAVLLLRVLERETFSPVQMMDAVRIVKSYKLKGVSYRSLIMDLSLLMGNGEEFYQMTIHNHDS